MVVVLEALQQQPILVAGEAAEPQVVLELF